MLNTKKRAAAWGMALALLCALSFVATSVEARVGGGSSFGSRGSRTFSSPPATNTALRAAPIEKSITQPGKAPTTAPSPVGGNSWFGGWRGILLGGLFAGILASIFGFGALASVLGFLLQAALVVGIVWLVMSFFSPDAACDRRRIRRAQWAGVRLQLPEQLGRGRKFSA
jgi:hypothetical protein